MSQITHLSRTTSPTASDDQVAKVIEAVRLLLSTLPREAQERFLRDLMETLSPIPVPRAGDVLGAIVRLIPRNQEWTVHDVKQQVAVEGVAASAKEIYNALGYLTRKKHVRRIGYGRYIVDGVMIETSDDLGGELARDDHE